MKILAICIHYSDLKHSTDSEVSKTLHLYRLREDQSFILDDFRHRCFGAMELVYEQELVKFYHQIFVASFQGLQFCSYKKNNKAIIRLKFNNFFE